MTKRKEELPSKSMGELAELRDEILKLCDKENLSLKDGAYLFSDLLFSTHYVARQMEASSMLAELLREQTERKDDAKRIVG